jgi:glycerol-3-phosphate O-acyltransferase
MWGRAPDREGLVAARAAVGELGARRSLPPLLSVVVNGRNLFVQFGDPISLARRAR